MGFEAVGVKVDLYRYRTPKVGWCLDFSNIEGSAPLYGQGWSVAPITDIKLK